MHSGLHFLMVFLHTTSQREYTAACQQVATTFTGHAHSMHQDMDDELPNTGLRKKKKRIRMNAANTNTWYSTGLTQNLLAL